MTKSARQKKYVTQHQRENVISLEQKMRIELIESEIQQIITELNTLPRTAISAFLIPLLINFLFQGFFLAWEGWFSKLFIKLQLLSDEMDPFILNMTTDYLEAKSVIEGFSRGDVKSEYVISQIKTFCQQITHSPLLKKLNFNPERMSHFTQECYVDFTRMSPQELQQSYKRISDKHRVVQSITVEDLLKIANKQHFFSSLVGVLCYNVIAKNTIDPFFNSIIRYPLFYPTPPFLNNDQKITLNHDTANRYVEKLVKQKKALSHHHYYQKIFFRLLIASLLILYFLFGIGQSQMSILFFGLINLAFSGLWREIQTQYQQYHKEKNTQKKYEALKLLFKGISCHIEQKMTEKNGKSYFLLRFSAKQVISNDHYPVTSHHIIRSLLKLLREQEFKIIYDKKNTVVIDGNFSLSHSKFQLIQKKIKECINRCSMINDGIKKLKTLMKSMHEFGVNDGSFIQDLLHKKIVIKVSFSMSLPDTVEKMQQLVSLVTNQELGIFYCYNQACIGEFILDSEIAQTAYLLALNRINEWKKKKHTMLIAQLPEEYEKPKPDITILPSRKSQKASIQFAQANRSRQEEQYQNIHWKSGAYYLNDRHHTIYALHGRGLPEGRYFITSRLKRNIKINQETIDKILKVMAQGKVAVKRGEPGVQLVRKEKGVSRHFHRFSYFAKVKIFASGGVGEPRGLCTEFEISEDKNHVLYILTDICKKVH